MELSDDRHPQIEVTYGGKHEYREPAVIDAEEFIGKKGLQAKGKKASQYEVKGIRFTEPVHKPEDDDPATAQDVTGTGTEDTGDTGGGTDEEADEQLSLF